MCCWHAHNFRGTLSQFAAWLESGCLRSDGSSGCGSPHLPTSGKYGPPCVEALPGLEKDQNRRARLAMRCGLLCLPNFGELDPIADPTILLSRATSELAECRVECESTPTMLWMSSNKRYIWYFTLHYGNLLSKHRQTIGANRKTAKGLAEGANLTDASDPR